MSCLVRFRKFYQKNFITNELSKFHVYNKQICMNCSFTAKNYAFNWKSKSISKLVYAYSVAFIIKSPKS